MVDKSPITLITGNPALKLLTAGTLLIRKLHISNAERLDVGTQCLCASGWAIFERVF